MNKPTSEFWRAVSFGAPLLMALIGVGAILAIIGWASHLSVH